MRSTKRLSLQLNKQVREDPKAELEEMQTKDVHPVTSEKLHKPFRT